MSDKSTLDSSPSGSEASTEYDLPFVTKYIRRARHCQYLPISPSFVNCESLCLQTPRKKRDECKLTEENELVPLQKE
jgi:hypothetical protein